MKHSARWVVAISVLSLLFHASFAQANFGGSVDPRATRALKSRTKHSGPTGAYSKIYESFVSRDYSETERLAKKFVSTNAPDIEKADALYLKALSFQKRGRADDAREAFREMERLPVTLELKAMASVSIADSFYFEGKPTEAEQAYRATEAAYPNSTQSDYVSSRLKQLAEGSAPHEVGTSGSYTVQVGSFSKHKNASQLVDKLTRQDLNAYLEKGPNERMYRVRVGHFSTRREADQKASELRRMGYPTKIYP